MKIIIPTLAIAIISILLIYLFLLRKENKEYKKKVELMEFQISVVNRLIEDKQVLEIDNQAIEYADYQLEEGNEKTLLYYSKIKNTPDACITIDAEKRIKYIGFYKP